MSFITKTDLILSILGTSVLLCICSFQLNNNSFMALGAFFAGLAGGLILLRNLVYVKSKLQFTSVLAASTLLSTGLGTITAYTSFNSEYKWNLFLKGINISSTSTVAKAQLAVNLYCFCLLLLGLLSESKFFREKNSNRLYLVPSLTSQLLLNIVDFLKIQKNIIFLLRIAGFISLAQLYFLASGKVGFQTELNNIGTEGLALIDPKVQLISGLLPTIIFSLGFLLPRFKKIIEKNIEIMILYIPVTFVQFAWLLLAGSRRGFIFSTFLFILGFRLSFVGQFVNFSKKQFKKVVLVIGLVILFGILSVQITSFFRLVYNANADFKNFPFIEKTTYVIQNFVDYYFFGSQKLFKSGVVESNLSQNYSERPFILSALAMMMEWVINKSPLFGEDLLANLVRSTPRVLFPGKFAFLRQEELYKMRFDIPESKLQDFADSFYLSAFVDFSWWGLIIYPVLIYCLLYVLLRLAYRSKFRLIHLIVISSLFYFCFNGVESAFNLFFVTLRDLIILIMLFSLYGFFFQ